MGIISTDSDLEEEINESDIAVNTLWNIITIAAGLPDGISYEDFVAADNLFTTQKQTVSVISESVLTSAKPKETKVESDKDESTKIVEHLTMTI